MTDDPIAFPKQKRAKTGGRKPGVPNQTTQMLKDALLPRGRAGRRDQGAGVRR